MKRLGLLLLLCSTWASAQTCTGVSDTFSGSGALNSSNWSQWSGVSGYGTLNQVSSTAQPSAPSTQGAAEWTGTIFTADQCSKVVVSATLTGSTGPIVRSDNSGNSYLWFILTNSIYKLTAGAGSLITSSCPNVTTGDTIILGATGTSTTTLTCLDVTSGLISTGVDSSSPYTTGSPGILVDRRSGTTDALSSFAGGTFTIPNTITAVVPSCSNTNCNVVLPDSTRQILVHVTGGPTNQVTWAVTSGSATVSSPNNLPTALVTIGSGTSAGASITPAAGNPGPWTVSGSTNVVITATLVDDPTQTATFNFIVSPTIDTVYVLPAYRQAWLNKGVELYCQILGIATVDEKCTWSLTTNPGVAGSLSDTPNRDTIFTATATGKYIVTATEVNSPHNTATGSIWATNASYPYTANPNGVEIQPADCTDPAFTTATTVGPGKAHATISSVINGSLATGTCVQWFNTDTTGLSPTTYPEYLQYIPQGTQANPIYVVGVPDSFGNLPIQTGDHATGNASIAGAFAATGEGLNLYYCHDSTHGSCYGYYPNETGPSYITVANMHQTGISFTTPYYYPGSPTITSISRSSNTVTAVVSAASSYSTGQQILVQNVTGGSTSFNGTFGPITLSGTTITYTQTGANESGTTSGSSAALGFWGGEISSCNDHFTGDHNSWLGDEFDACNEGIWTNDNVDQYEWAGVSAQLYLEGNNFNQLGRNTDDEIHGAYLQGRNVVAVANWIHNPLSGMQGGGLKWRGTNGIFAYNVIQGPFLRCFDGVEVQGGSDNVSMLGYLGNAYQFGDTGGVPLVAAMQEQLFHDVLYGNICDTGAAQAIHYAVDVDPGIGARTGQLFMSYNTLNMGSGGQTVVINSGSNNGYNFSDYFTAREQVANNSLWGTGGGFFSINQTADFIPTFQSNLFDTGQVVYSGTLNTGVAGWSYACDGTCPWLLTTPLQTHMSGLTSGNFLFTPTNPITTNYVPISGSALNSAATALTGVASYFPVRFYYDLTTNTLKPRTDIVSGWPTTIGAVPGSGAPTLVSIAVTPNPATVIVTGTQQMTATGTYSDSSTANLTSSAAWSNSGSAHFSVSAAMFQNLQLLGSGGLTKQSGTACCGGSNTGSSAVTYNNASPSLTGNSIALTSTGNNYNTQLFTNGLDCTTLPGGNCSGMNDIVAEVHVYIPSGTSTPLALEGPNTVLYTGTFQLYPSVQCDSASGNWRLWNGAGGTWVSSGHACTGFLTATNTWHDIKAHYTVNQGADTMTYVELDFDGTPVFSGGSTTYSGVSDSSAASFKAQVQIDGSTIGSPASTIYYDQWSVTANPGVAGLVTGISVGTGTATATQTSISGNATVNNVGATGRSWLGATTRKGGTVSK